MAKVTEAQRRSVLSRTLRFGPGSTVESIVRSLVGLHSSDPASVYLALWARMPDYAAGHLETALYEERSLLRILGMRRTMFVVPRPMASVVHHSSTADLVGAERRRTWKMIESSDIADDAREWVEDVCVRTFETLKRLGPSTAIELREHVPELRKKLTVRKRDGSVAGTTGVSTRILFLLATEGRIVRGRPRGSWLSSQYQWATFEEWTNQPMPVMDPGLAREHLLRNWFESFGPGTEVDLKWWTGWRLTTLRQTLARLDIREFATEQGVAYALDGVASEEQGAEDVYLLPGLDPSIMAWKGRDWYLGEHGPHLFDKNGNAGPTIVSQGRVIGGWGQGADGSIRYRLLEDVGSEAQELVANKAGALTEWLNGVVVTPRFRTPLERELST